MKRIIMMLALTALLVVVLSLSALSAFAAKCPGNPNCNGPGKTEDASGTPPVVHFDPGAASGRR